MRSNTRDRVGTSSQKNSFHSKPSLLDESLEPDDRIFKTNDDYINPMDCPDYLPILRSQPVYATSMEAIEEEATNHFDTFDIKAVNAEDNFTFDISQSRDCLQELRPQDLRASKNFKEPLELRASLHDMLLSGGFGFGESGQKSDRSSRVRTQLDFNGQDDSQKQSDRKQDDSSSNTSKLMNLSKSINLGSNSNPFQLLAELKEKSTKKDKIIKFLKELLRRLLEEMENLTTKSLYFEPEAFKAADLERIDFRLNIPIEDARLQALPTRIC